jgi:hypothetical protein
MTELEYITEKELLQYSLKEAQQIAKSQFIEIDKYFNLIKDGENYIPEIKITDSVNLVMITIRYNTQPLTELYMTKPKWIKRERMIYTYKEIRK